ncbi:MAG: hypothetical protein A2747_00270 [Candidatus Yonathbacteria bacterium RIFCSPHIGHO2_01_FULL_44_41]|uniref:Uncharacterized protein n=1 Tax=Candidatus Yonathbacteria bacterium RIFCSPHIGHO2_02_FULL_44_14 TaxID=1802724 RepID=A0A1G2S931_9BACT|nr:MAG: hypothetical protein A2747_00270 [Candidatus Yonathbacteria bacterium RIFCSPHIGHO2_01_FULL_44_41]OHA81184.1 MAG: hypothetical protein A3B06_00335 [Candidatus Yonathbacteria bacterium RIFCSPLOWO2_01_FULL_43_20]OHA81198.1 MAG: hypothetical protein A3D51_01180 [Candidatus Yonathbacteria bacterium RIFCSPHIGHO2_02_FULL_44_14]
MQVLLNNPATANQLLEVFTIAIETAGLYFPWKAMAMMEHNERDVLLPNKWGAVAYLEDRCKNGVLVTSPRIVLLPVADTPKVSTRFANIVFGEPNANIANPLCGVDDPPKGWLFGKKYADDFYKFIREFKGLTTVVVDK